jgi:hypothetical protein
MRSLETLHQDALASSRARRFEDVLRNVDEYRAQNAEGGKHLYEMTAGMDLMAVAAKAQLRRLDAAGEAVSVFGYYRADPKPVAQGVAAAALRIQLELSLENGGGTNAQTIVDTFESFISSEAGSTSIVQVAPQVIASAKALVQADANEQARELLRKTAWLLGRLETPDAVHLLAIARVWETIALVYGGAAAEVLETWGELDVRDPDIGAAINQVLRELKGQARWRLALILLSAFKVETLEWARNEAAARKIREGFVKAFAGVPDAAVQRVVERYVEELRAHE